MKRLSIVYFFVIGVFLLIQIEASAQDKNAQMHYVAGVNHFQNGAFKAASEEFRKAYALKPSWKIYYNIGQSEAAAKRYGLALDAFESYLTQGGDDVLDERRDEVLKELDRLRKIVGSLEIIVENGADIYIDGIKRGTTPLLGKLSVSAAVPHTVYAIIDGRKTPVRKFKVRGKDTHQINLKEEEASPPQSDRDGTLSSREEIEPENNENPFSTAMIISGSTLIGMGVAALIGGAVTGVKTRRLDDEINEACPESPCPSTLNNKIKRLDTLQRTTNILLISGGAVAAAGVIMFVLGMVYRNSGDDDESDEETEALLLQPTLTITPEFSGFRVRVAF